MKVLVLSLFLLIVSRETYAFKIPILGALFGGGKTQVEVTNQDEGAKKDADNKTGVVDTKVGADNKLDTVLDIVTKMDARAQAQAKANAEAWAGINKSVDETLQGGRDVVKTVQNDIQIFKYYSYMAYGAFFIALIAIIGLVYTISSKARISTKYGDLTVWRDNALKSTQEYKEKYLKMLEEINLLKGKIGEKEGRNGS